MARVAAALRCSASRSFLRVAVRRPWGPTTSGVPLYLLPLRTSSGNYTLIFSLWPILRRIPAELGRKTSCNGAGSKNGAERTQTQPRRPIVAQFR